MSLSLDTVFQVVEIVQKAVEIYERIRDAPETIHKLGRRVRRLGTILQNLEKHLRTKPDHALDLLRKAQKRDLLELIEETHDGSKKVYLLFEKWEKKIGPMGIQFKDNAFAQYVAQAYFALGSSVKELEALAANIDYQRQEISQYLSMMGVQGIAENQAVLQGVQKQIRDLHKLVQAQAKQAAPQPDLEKQIKALNDLLKAQANLNVPPTPANNKIAAPQKSRLSPSPSPSPPRKDYRLIFIDPHNLGRGVCAEALTKLYGCATIMAGAVWCVTNVHSAGFFCKKGNDYTSLIENLDYKVGSYKLAMSKGGQPTNDVAIAAVFDNKSFAQIGKFQKETVQKQITSRVSQGIKRDVFKTYDFIIVFTNREHDNMIKLKQAVIASEGKDAASKAKGRVVHLGRYSTKDGTMKEIVDPPKNKDGTQSRDEWNKKVAQLKMAIRRFLEKELGWTIPENRPTAT